MSVLARLEEQPPITDIVDAASIDKELDPEEEKRRAR